MCKKIQDKIDTLYLTRVKTSALSRTDYSVMKMNYAISHVIYTIGQG